MNNYQHAAVVLKSLPRSTVEKFLAQLDPQKCLALKRLMERTVVTAERLHFAIAKLKRDGLGDLDAAAEPGKGTSAPGPIDLGRAKPERAATKMNNLAVEEPFAFLKMYTAETLVEIFSRERPGDAAVVLATLPTPVASAILKELPMEHRLDIVGKMAVDAEPEPAEVAELEFALRLRIEKMSREQSEPQPLPSGTPLENDLKETVSQSQPLMERLAELSNKQIKTLLQNVDTSHLAPALKTCSIRVQQRVLRNMARKPAEIVAREILDVRLDDKHRILRASKSLGQAIEKIRAQDP